MNVKEMKKALRVVAALNSHISLALANVAALEPVS